MRYFLELSYDGTNYAGWQKQPNASTVQGAIEEALKIYFKEEIPIYGCGRTDSGVHATFYIAHLDLSIGPDEAIHALYKLNRILSKGIACHQLRPVTASAHARFDAERRSYTYNIHTFKNPFKSKYSTFINYGHKLDYDLLHQVAEVIGSTHQFGSFCKLHGSDTTMDCTIYESKWIIDRGGHEMSYHITANRFLRGMVRLIVGSSLAVSCGKMTLDQLKAHMSEGSRNPYMQSAPPEGLALSNVIYPQLTR